MDVSVESPDALLKDGAGVFWREREESPVHVVRPLASSSSTSGLGYLGARVARAIGASKDVESAVATSSALTKSKGTTGDSTDPDMNVLHSHNRTSTRTSNQTSGISLDGLDARDANALDVLNAAAMRHQHTLRKDSSLGGLNADGLVIASASVSGPAT